MQSFGFVIIIYQSSWCDEESAVGSFYTYVCRNLTQPAARVLLRLVEMNNCFTKNNHLIVLFGRERVL